MSHKKRCEKKCEKKCGACKSCFEACVVNTTEDLQLSSAGKACLTEVFASGEGVIVTLPSNPVLGERFLITAQNGSVVLRGSGNFPLQCSDPDGLFIESGTSREVIFDGTSWVLTSEVSHCLDSAFLSQNTWYINALTGNNTLSGKTPAQALRTYAEWSRRVGSDTILTPTGGKGTLTLLTDIPVTDPITFDNELGEKTAWVITGTKKVVKSGVLAAVMTEVPSTNTPAKVRAAGLGAAHVDLFILITSGPATGSLAMLAKDEGGGTLWTTQWMTSQIEADGFVYPAPAPSAGDSYKVLDYTKARLSQCHITTLSSDGPVGFAVTNLRLVNSSVLPVSDGNFSGDAAVVNCILEDGADGYFSNGGLYDCIVKGNVSLKECNVTFIGGLFHPHAGAEYPGAIDGRGANIQFVGYPMFLGDNNGYADFRVRGGYVEASVSMAFFYAFHGPFSNLAGHFSFNADDGYGNLISDRQLWGSNNGDLIPFVGANGSFDFNQVAVGPGPIPFLPSYANDRGPEIFYLSSQATLTDTGHAWMPASAVFTQALPTTWAEFAVPIPAGFEVDRFLEPGFEHSYADACNPGIDNSVTFTAYRFF